METTIEIISTEQQYRKMAKKFRKEAEKYIDLERTDLAKIYFAEAEICMALADEELDKLIEKEKAD